ncbi:hypothetical protein [Epilithonimonas hominis]|uniref:hypothetical protein n=1 Tax=Epilithonimonas hominis TaxID=420404 RepID=UPI00289EC4EF|nr:hypothetical protein [Epilithonimonas hominis]
MSFPKHNILPDSGDHTLFKELHQKRIGFSPLVFCEFFQGMDVLQIQGAISKEYIFALYFSGKLIGHAYFGSIFSEEDILQIKRLYFPPTWDQLQEYVNKTSDVWYYKFAPEQYAFVLNKVLQKIE